MNVRVDSCSIKGQINAIPSKSFAHRVCICDFLSNQEIRDKFSSFNSKDITATANCLNAIKRGEKTLDCDESGSTLRFLLPLSATLGGEFLFVGKGRLMQRPNQELFEVLTSHGVSVSQDETGIKIKGKLTAGEYKIRGDVSSQYISGLLMALPNLDGDSKIVLRTPLSSKPYVDITIQVLREYGVEIQSLENGYFIKGCQTFKGNGKVEGDWSNMAFFLCLGAIAGEIIVNGLNLNSVQGDKKILSVLESAGAQVICEKDKITIKKSNLKPFSMDADDCPDLVPICAVLGAYASGTTIIKNVQRLKIKESDRITSTIAMLNAFNINAEFDGKNLIVFGGKVKGGKINSYNDHRIVMASAVLGSGAIGQSEIIDADAVNKSYPIFFNDYQSVGGIANVF